MGKQEIINGNVHTYDDAGRLMTVLAKSLTQQCPDCGQYVPDISYCAHTCWVRDLHFRDYSDFERDALNKRLDEQNKMPKILQPQCDILSTPAEIKSDDAEVAALMMEADITAPIKEQASWVLAENDSLKAQLASVIAQLKEAKEQNSELTRKAKLYDGYFVLLAQCLHDVKV